ncbi:hypothetical protein HDU91_005648 [Kappamyces sp. JEL0680]|nr:hypothetical protein HDU91_005648 [Kappamyces sp. JEL0680]
MQDLAGLADKLISDLDFWIGSTKPAVIAPLAKTFMSSFISYYNAFEAWKSRDTLKIVDELIGHFMELDAVWIKVFANENAFDEWAVAVEEQQSQHLARIKKFGPDAVDRLLHARQTFIASVLAGDVEVVIATVDDPTCAAHKLYLAPAMKQDSVAPAAVPEEQSEDAPSPEEMARFGDILSNEHLAHEMALDPEFSLKPSKKSPLEEQVTAMAKKAFADSVRKDVSSGNYSKTVMGVVQNLCDVSSGR